MDAVKSILLVAFVIICVLLVLLVLVQNEDSNGMGSAFGGGQSTAFGAKSGSVLKKTTGVLVALFFIVTFFIAVFNRPSKAEDLSETVKQLQGDNATAQESKDWAQEILDEANVPAEEEATEPVIEAAATEEAESAE
ncbi:MAG: preprotein translocase subunit SecG [Treponema sp.]|nr:preprotein translocase subunit SecG [Treponema sp.]